MNKAQRVGNRPQYFDTVLAFLAAITRLAKALTVVLLIRPVEWVRVVAMGAVVPVMIIGYPGKIRPILSLSKNPVPLNGSLTIRGKGSCQQGLSELCLFGFWISERRSYASAKTSF